LKFNHDGLLVRCQINRILTYFACLLTLVACKKKENPEALHQPVRDSSSMSLNRSDSQASLDSATAQIRPARSFLLKSVVGVIFSTGTDSLATLAIEIENREVIILVGEKARVLRNRQHQKMSVTGFWRPAAIADARDSLEVADFAFIRE